MSKSSKSVCDIQFSATADIFNDYFLSIAFKTIANVISKVPDSEYMDKLFDPLWSLYLLMLNQCHLSYPFCILKRLLGLMAFLPGLLEPLLIW